MTAYTTGEVIELLRQEGWARTDTQTVIDAFIEGTIPAWDEDEGYLWTEEDLDALREQLSYATIDQEQAP